MSLTANERETTIMSTRFGWCQCCTEQYEGIQHERCKASFVNTYGVPVVCSCPQHLDGGDTA